MPKNRAPVAILGTPVINGRTVQVDGSASHDPDGTIKRWKISWGDGESEEGSGTPGVAEHTYGEAGTFDVVLLVQDNKNSKTSTTVAVVIQDTTPVPVDCVLSEATFGPWESSSAWTPCVAGTQSRQEQRTWTKTVVTPPANGGAACGPTSGVETRTVTQACVVPPTGKTVVGPDDLIFKGFYKLDRYALLYWNRGGLAVRTVNGQKRFLMLGDETVGDELLEYSLPSSGPHVDLSQAPEMPLTKNWGKPFTKQWTGAGNSSSWLGGLYWDEARKAVWYTYGEGYIPTGHDPSLGAVVLNDANGTTQTYGNWRTQWSSQRTRGAFCDLPQAFADAHLGGRRVGIMSFQTSGNFSSPFGACLSAIALPDPVTTPPDGPTDRGDWTVANHGLLLHDIDHRQARDTNYALCKWNVQYDCNQGSTITPGVPLMGGPDPAAGQDDSINSGIWIDLPDKHAFIHFGQLGHGHHWYGDPNHTGGSMYKQCCHGQDDPWWGATGPGAHQRHAMGWFYDPAHLVGTAQGTTPLHGVTPAHTVNWHDRVPQLDPRYGSGIFGGAYFDASLRRVYVLLMRHDRQSHPPHARTVVMVFDVR